MSPWLFAATAMFVALVPAAAVVLRGGLVDRLVGLAFGGTAVALFLFAAARDAHRSSFEDLAFALALLSYGGSLVFARFVERWL